MEESATDAPSHLKQYLCITARSVPLYQPSARYLGDSTCLGHFRGCLLERIAGRRYENRPLIIRKMPFWRERTANDEFWEFSMDVKPVKQLILVD